LLSIKADDLIFSFIVLTFFLLPTGTAPPLISIVLASLVWLVSGKVCHIKSIIRQPWFYPVVPFMVLPWIGLLYSQNIDLGMDYAFKTKYWFVLLITAGLAFDDQKVFVLLKWFWAGLLMGAVLALIQVIGIMTPIKEAYLGFGIVHTLISMYLIIGIMTASFYFKTAGSWKSKSVFLFLILAFLFHLAILRGRSGYLIFGIISPLVADNLVYRFSLKVKIAIAVILAGSLLLSPVVKDEISSTFDLLNENRERILKGEYVVELSRFFMVCESVRVFIDHPFAGIGTGSLTEPTQKRGHAVEHPHNNFLYMGASFGILGIAACFWLFWKMLKLSWRSRETAQGYFVFSACSVLFLGGMFDTQILNTGPLLFLSLSYGFLNHLRNPVD
jgi:O-Antigen ligase